jgi:hypothetical protein
MSNSSLNATKHGCCAVDARLLPGESEKEFKNLERIWTEAYNPKTDAQRHMVTELVNADWLLQRTTRQYLDIEAKLYAQSTNPLDWTEEQQRTLGRFQRYRTAHTNTVARCRKALEDYRKYRFIELTQHQTVEINRERLKTAQQKSATKNGDIVDWQQHLKNMRDQAVSMGFVPPEPPNPMKR